MRKTIKRFLLDTGGLSTYWIAEIAINICIVKEVMSFKKKKTLPESLCYQDTCTVSRTICQGLLLLRTFYSEADATFQ